MIQGRLNVWWYLYAGVWRFYAALSSAENSGICWSWWIRLCKGLSDEKQG